MIITNNINESTQLDNKEKNENFKPPNYLIKFLLLGEKGVGKKSLIKKVESLKCSSSYETDFEDEKSENEKEEINDYRLIPQINSI